MRIENKANKTIVWTRKNDVHIVEENNNGLSVTIDEWATYFPEFNYTDIEDVVYPIFNKELSFKDWRVFLKRELKKEEWYHHLSFGDKRAVTVAILEFWGIVTPYSKEGKEYFEKVRKEREELKCL